MQYFHGPDQFGMQTRCIKSPKELVQVRAEYAEAAQGH